MSRVLADFGARVDLLRSSGAVSDETVSRYYKERRFEQVAESNALEGSTLSVGETELAVLQGVTLTGHDPGYSKDARALFRAVERVAELARSDAPVDIPQLREIHALVLGDRPGAGVFRTDRVIIRGSEHRPPKTREAVIAAMEAWEEWSLTHAVAPHLLRAAILHTWLTHIHPFIDGNGRTARAVLNLELIRGGVPPIIIRRKDRTRYLDALAESDQGGDIGPIFDLLLTRAGHALHDMERHATAAASYDPIVERIRRAQQNRAAIWNAAVQLFVERLNEKLSLLLESSEGTHTIKWYDRGLDVDDYVALCSGNSVGNAWVFLVELQIPGLAPLRRLAWVGFRSDRMKRTLADNAADVPSLFWSAPNPAGYPRWARVIGTDAPGADELTLVDDSWRLLQGNHTRSLSPADAGQSIAAALVEMVA